MILASIFAERINEAKTVADEYGGTDGSWHKQWVIDQMVRALCGNEETYQAWVAAHNDGEEGPNTYEWEVGCAP